MKTLFNIKALTNVKMLEN